MSICIFEDDSKYILSEFVVLNKVIDDESKCFIFKISTIGLASGVDLVNCMKKKSTLAEILMKGKEIWVGCEKPRRMKK